MFRWCLLGLVTLIWAEGCVARSVSRSAVIARNFVFEGHRLHIRVAVPDGAPPASGYPVVYVLDGNAEFGSMVDTVTVQAAAPTWTGVSPAIVVGIDVSRKGIFDPRRRYLYTPVAQVDGGVTEGGGADVLVRFLEHRLRPWIASRYPVDGDRQILFGHSLGGLFTLHALFSRPSLFRAYIAASPSIWWADRAILRERDAFLVRSGNALEGRCLLVTVGEHEATPGPDAQAAPGLAERTRTLNESRMVDNARELAASMQALRGKGLETRFDLLAGEDHMSVIPTAEARAVRFAFGRQCDR